ncbi:hypothetical protein PIB30_071690 [Stylosanthes scabra]|uniref:Ubiquitin-like protease family profile domain-containing protein n=1 Tax=Stylosanthes scabra TaxID=79078 RepID=A0ABU6RNT0_9FABA|nr:hypothetical protein [Stylosanthes scabra]
MCRSPDGSAVADSHVAREIPKDDDGGDVDPTIPSFNLGISQDEIDMSDSLSPKTVDVDGGLLVPIRVIEFMCYMLNDLPCKRFEAEIYCVNPMILGRIMTPTNLENFQDKDNPVYVGLKECWGPDVILFDKQQAARRHTLFFPICLEHHWWMYAFHPKSQNLWALDSIFRPPLTEHRKNVDR